LKFLALADGANPKSLVAGEAVGKAVWMLVLKKINSFYIKRSPDSPSRRLARSLKMFTEHFLNVPPYFFFYQ